MPPQTRRPRPGPAPRQAPTVTPPVVDIPPEIPVPDSELVDVHDPRSPLPDLPDTAYGDGAVPLDVATEPPPFDPDDPQPGQSIAAFVPHSGYTSFAYGTRAFDIDPDTDCIIRERA